MVYVVDSILLYRHTTEWFRFADWLISGFDVFCLIVCFCLIDFDSIAFLNTSQFAASFAVWLPLQFTHFGLNLFFNALPHLPGSCNSVHLTHLYGRLQLDALWVKRWHRRHWITFGFRKKSNLIMAWPMAFISKSSAVSVFGCRIICHRLDLMAFFRM